MKPANSPHQFWTHITGMTIALIVVLGVGLCVMFFLFSSPSSMTWAEVAIGCGILVGSISIVLFLGVLVEISLNIAKLVRAANSAT